MEVDRRTSAVIELVLNGADYLCDGTNSTEPGKNRKIRNATIYPKIAVIGERAVILKLADRIANVVYSLKTGNRDKFMMYKGEFLFFHQGLQIHAIRLSPNYQEP